MQDRIETIIRDWLNKEFKNPKAIPGLMVKGLAEEINSHRWEIYENVRDEYDLEDISMVAENNDITLTKDEESYVFNRYRKAQEYESSIDILDEIINEVIDQRKNKEK